MVIFILKDKNEAITHPNAAKSFFYNTQPILLYILCLAELPTISKLSANKEISTNKVILFIVLSFRC